jgi:23S rRNA pseudouridine1911/1915/1917 synthase
MTTAMIAVRAEAADAGKRLDHFLQEKLPQFSRSRLQEWIKDGRVSIAGRACSKVSLSLKGGEQVDVSPADPPPLKAEAEDLPVEVLYEDEDVVAVNKPAGIVVHAGAGNHAGTLVNRLVHRFQTSLSSVGGDQRPGIVHRLDKDTSGVLLVAKHDAAHRALAEQFSSRTTEKIYLALVHGSVQDDNGRISLKIQRDPARRIRMSTHADRGRTALTDYKVQQRFGTRYTYLRVRIGTGRTHQIRVHLAAIGHPVVGDVLYGGSGKTGLARFFLHAHRIKFDSPTTAKRITVEAPLPPELAEFLKSIDAAD